MLFVDAVKARLPIITVTTRDLMNFKDVVKFVTGKSPKSFNPDVTYNEGDLLYIQSEKALQHADKIYGKLAGCGATLIVINSPKPIPESFDAGELFVPITQVRQTLLDVYTDPAQPDPEMVAFVDTMLPTLGGLTLKEVGEVIRLTEVRDDHITPQGVTRTRAVLVPNMQGFSAVMTTMDGPYLPNPELAKFVAERKVLFLDPDEDPRLVPKGILFDGEPGTGKTQGAKWLADQWGVPLYRLDASILNKYYGESENNLRSIFAKVGQEAPCILFIDEVEKLFGRRNDGEGNGMVERMLSMMLWQMQESRDRVFFAMTSNKKGILPPELIREGRIDQTITFVGLEKDEAFDFAQIILASFVPKDKQDDILPKRVNDRIKSLFAGKDRASHSAVTEAVKAVVTATKVAKALAKQGG